MKLIIDIPKELVTDIKDYCGMSMEALPIIVNAIYNGISLEQIKTEIEKELELENADIQSEYSQGGYDVLKRLFNTDIFR